MIELTEQQQQTLDREQPPRLIDPRNNTAYVLVRADVFERLKDLVEDAEDQVLREAWLRASHQSAVSWMKENPY
jgi:hypothetical protein